MTSPREFGSTLRRARERRNISLKAIEQQTKISATLLDALENGDCSRWPGGIYSRAWIRAYARAVDIDPDETAAAFADCFLQTAYPGANPKKVVPPPVVSSLRLTLEPAPRERWRQVVRRGLLLTTELGVILSLAAGISMANVAGFWMSVALLSLLCNVVGIATGDGSAAGFMLRVIRDARHSDKPEHARESALAEAA